LLKFLIMAKGKKGAKNTKRVNAQPKQQTPKQEEILQGDPTANVETTESVYIKETGNAPEVVTEIEVKVQEPRQRSVGKLPEKTYLLLFNKGNEKEERYFRGNIKDAWKQELKGYTLTKVEEPNGISPFAKFI
jgi:hypothetical protein